MARRNNVELENVELKPQIIGHTYKKKSNLGRIIFVIVLLILVVFYIDDVSVFLNRLFGRETADTIKENAMKDEQFNLNNSSNYKIITSSLVIKKDNLTYNNFKYLNNVISFDVTNESNLEVDMSSKKLYLETYKQKDNPFLAESLKINLGVINPHTKQSFVVEANEEFEVIAIVEKNEKDYPNYSITYDESGIGKLSCNKDLETLVYSFKDKKLISIRHTYHNFDKDSSTYQEEYNNYKNMVNEYSKIAGFNANFKENFRGFEIDINIDSAKANLSNIQNFYYYGYNEEVKVINFEMEAQGFNCK